MDERRKRTAERKDAKGQKGVENYDCFLEWLS